MLNCDYISDTFVIYLNKKDKILDVIPPIRDFFSIYTTAAFVIPVTLWWIKTVRDDYKDKKKERQEKMKDKEEFTKNTFLEIKDDMTKIMFEQGKMMGKEDAQATFVDNKRFDLQTKTFNKRLDIIEETAKENKNDLKKTAEENKNDLKEFITQALQLINRSK